MKDILYENGHMVVRENYCCDHFEPDDDALVPMKECWCCKWSKFDTEIHELDKKSVGICQYEGNDEANSSE